MSQMDSSSKGWNPLGHYQGLREGY